MSMTSAERQARYRKRQKEKIDALRSGAAPDRNVTDEVVTLRSKVKKLEAENITLRNQPDIWEAVTLHIDSGHAVPDYIVELVMKEKPLWELGRQREREKEAKAAKRKKENEQRNTVEGKKAEDAKQQERWKKLYEAATEELFYVDTIKETLFTPYKVQPQNVTLRQTVRVVKRTANQIRIVAMFLNRNVTRYKYRQISSERRYSTIEFRSISDDPWLKERSARWRLLDAVLFTDEAEYQECRAKIGDDTKEKLERESNKSNFEERRKGHRNKFTTERHVTLGIEGMATQEEIKQAYRKKAQEKHPDKGGDPDEFRQVKEAYEWLRVVSRPR